MKQIGAALFSDMTFGDMLKHLRQRVQMTQRELGIAVGYSEGYITRLEGNQRLPTLATIRTRFVEALDLQHEPDLANRLIQLAQAARGIETVVPDGLPVPPKPQTSNLPGSLTRFIGRAHELVQVSQFIGQRRLVTLTGTGGVGKTRLAIEAAGLCVDQFDDGLWLVELAPLVDPALVPRAVAEVFGLPNEPGHSPQQRLIEHLRDSNTLIVLDNCEHLITACAQLVEALLRACTRLTILATSREALRLPGEVPWRVASLATPDPVHLPSPAQVLNYDAVQLFVEHAAAALPGFELTPDNLKTIAQICYRLDGIPLAIEMAAALVSILPIHAIAAGLDDRFDLLTLGSRTALPRHQTLRATLEWSYNLLSTPERVLLERLSIFAGGATVDAARAVCADSEVIINLNQADIQALLLQLVRKSLLVTDAPRRDNPYAEQTRYRMLETMRQYAAEKLNERGETDSTYERMAAYLGALGHSNQPVHLSDEAEARLHAELDNIRALIAWARAKPDPAASLRMVTLLGLQFTRGYLAEPLAWLADALARGTTAPAKLRLQAQVEQLRLLKFSGYNLSRWATKAEESLPMVDMLTDQRVIAESLFWFGTLFWDLQDYDRIAELHQRGYQLGMGPDPEKKGKVGGIFAWGLGLVCMKKGDTVGAKRYFEETLRVAQARNDGNNLHLGINGLNWIDVNAALTSSEQALAHFKMQPLTETMPKLLQVYAQPLIMTGQYDRAKEVLEESRRLWLCLGVRWAHSMGLAQTLLDLGQIAWLEGDLEEALTRYTQSLEDYRQVGDLERIARLHIYIGLIRLAQGNSDHIAADFRYGLTLYRELGQPAGIGMALAGFAALAESRKQPERAARMFGAASQWCDMLPVSILWPACGVIYERELALARSRLCSAELSSAWAEGERLTLDQAVVYALAG